MCDISDVTEDRVTNKHKIQTIQLNIYLNTAAKPQINEKKA